jgi:hypothetical protein
MRSSGFDRASALLAAFSFGASGFVVAHVQHAPHLAVGSWLPWLLFCQHQFWHARVEGRRAVPWFLLASLSIGLQFLGGFPQMALLNIATFALFGIFSPVIWRRSMGSGAENQQRLIARRFAEAALITISTVVLGAGLGAIQLLPSAELLGLSIRGKELGTDFFTSLSVEPLALTQFISPFGFLGAPEINNMEFWAYAGVLPFSLALLAPLLRRDVRTWLLLLLALLSLAFALGDLNPFYQWLYYVPLFNRFRVPARFLFLLTFALAYLAAIGFQELQERLRDAGITHAAKILAALFVLATTGVVGLAYHLPSESWMEAWQWLPVFLVLSGIGTLLAARLRLTTRSVFAMTVLGLTLFDLLTFAAPFLNFQNLVAPAVVTQVPRTVRAMDDTQTLYRVFSNNFPSSSFAAVRAALWPNFSLQYAKQGVTIYAPLALQRNEEYIAQMAPTMQNLTNIRYYLLPLETTPPGEPSAFDESEPNGGLTLDVLSQQPHIPPTRVARIEITSYTDQTTNLPDGFSVGELTLQLDSGKTITMPIRLGIEAADWAYDGLAGLSKVNHAKPTQSLVFGAYTSQVGHEFEGRKYIAYYDVVSRLAPLVITAVGARSFLPGAGLTIEHIALIDETGQRVSLATLLGRNDLALTFRSHTAAMWENRDVLPRAFIVHAAEIVQDEHALARLRQPDFRPDRVVLLGDAAQLITLPKDASEGTDAAAIAEYQPERVVVKTKTDEVGYLMLTDSWYPGWVAFVDGKETPIHRADYIFRAVPLTPGEHSVVFEYRPMSLLWGAIISGLSVIACGVGVGIVVSKKQTSEVSKTSEVYSCTPSMGVDLKVQVLYGG